MRNYTADPLTEEVLSKMTDAELDTARKDLQTAIEHTQQVMDSLQYQYGRLTGRTHRRF